MLVPKSLLPLQTPFPECAKFYPLATVTFNTRLPAVTRTVTQWVT